MLLTFYICINFHFLKFSLSKQEEMHLLFSALSELSVLLDNYV
jgi:hypothetical protein